MANPLLESDGLPSFTRIRASHAEPAIDAVLADNRRTIAELLAQGPPFTWDSLIVPLEELDDRLSRVWSPVGHLNAVANTEALRDAHKRCLAKLSDYASEIGQNASLYRASLAVAEIPELTPAQRRTVEHAVRDFRLSGVGLDGEAKDRFRTIMRELSDLQARFEEHVLDATNGWTRHVTDTAEVAGLPAHALSRSRGAAEEKGLDGWLFTLDFPSYHAVITHAESRDLRHEFYRAWVTRASDQGPHAGRWDNTELMHDILALRHESAQLVGFDSYADYSLATKMASTPDEVLSFLDDLIERSRPTAEAEMRELAEFARAAGCQELAAWDIAFYSERQRQQRFRISDEELRPYFPGPRVLDGLFAVVKQLFGIDIRRRNDVDVWHDDVRYFELHDAGGVRGGFYVDLYARPHKRGGAWMDECIGRKALGRNVQHPVAFLTCNFAPAVGDRPALLTHDEVVTLFHEFGHCLQHLLTRVDYPSTAGISGVPWDAVELPSQFMENFAWTADVVPLISGHVDHGRPLPAEVFGRLLGTRTYQAGMRMLRQLEFAEFDFRLHHGYQPDQAHPVEDVLADVRERVALMPTPAFNRFAHSFTHVFGGGYAAGYYSYKWAEVLSADAWSAFEETSTFDAITGRRFADTILASGGTRDAMELFVEFRGRKPTIDALLRHSGIGIGDAIGP